MLIVSMTVVPGPEQGPGDILMSKIDEVLAWSLMREISKIIVHFIIYINYKLR